MSAVRLTREQRIAWRAIIRAEVEAAPPLTAAQLARLATLFDTRTAVAR